MGEIAIAMQEYLGDNEHFADLFNGIFFRGKQVFLPQQLSDSSEKYTVRRKGQKLTEECRDIKKILNNGTMLRVLSMEAQNYVDYMMPFRCMEYDVQENEAFLQMPEDAVEVMTKLLNWKELEDNGAKYMKRDEEGKERYNMCKALMDIKEEGILEKTKKVIENMINKGFEEADICQITECSHEFFDKVRREMTK